MGIPAIGLWTVAAPAAAQLLPRSPTGFNISAYEERWEDPSAAGTAAPLPTDRNRGDLVQTFAEVAVPLGGAELGVRGGRQEMLLGSGRLVDIWEGPNIRQRFDGVRGWARAGEARLDLFWTPSVENRPGWFDNRSDPNQQFYGAYSSTPVAPLPGLTLDVYAYRLRHDGAMLDADTAAERRDSFRV